MKIGYRTIGLADRSIDDALRTIADCGYDCVELCLENPDLNPDELTAERVDSLHALMDELGLDLAAVSYHGLQDQLEVRRQRTYKAIDLLPHFHADLFVVASRHEEPARLPAQWEEAVQLYCELADLCSEKGCRLAIEPQPGLVIRNTEDLVKVIRDCGRDTLVGNLDLAHASLSADDVSWAVFQLGTRLAHVHIADVRDGVHQHLIPGEGSVDFEEMRDILDNVDYADAVIIDISRPEGDPAEVCRSALQALRELWPA